MRQWWRGGLLAAVLAGGGVGGAGAAQPAANGGAAVGDRTVYGIQLGAAKGSGAPCVRRVDRSSPAWIAGLREGDEIVRVGDVPVRSCQDVVRRVAAVPRGQEVRIEARRTAASILVAFSVPPGGRAQRTRPGASPAGGSEAPARPAAALADGAPPATARARKPARHGRHPRDRPPACGAPATGPVDGA